MRTKKEEIPVEFKNKFNSFEEFRLYKVEVSKKQLEQAFEKVKTNGNKDWKEKIKTD
jgi:predicted negative regulator of RcsB-dependent stress response